MAIMIVMTSWAMVYNITTYLDGEKWLLFTAATIILALEVWMIVESVLVLRRVYGRARAD